MGEETEQENSGFRIFSSERGRTAFVTEKKKIVFTQPLSEDCILSEREK